MKSKTLTTEQKNECWLAIKRGMEFLQQDVVNKNLDCARRSLDIMDINMGILEKDQIKKVNNSGNSVKHIMHTNVRIKT